MFTFRVTSMGAVLAWFALFSPSGYGEVAVDRADFALPVPSVIDFNRPYSVLGVGLPGEREFTAVRQLYWNESGLVVLARLFPPASGNERGVNDQLDLFLDLRPRDSAMGHYEAGVFHFRVVGIGQPDRLSCQAVDSHNKGQVTPLISCSVTALKGAWLVRVSVPWSIFRDFRAEAGRWIGLSVRMTRIVPGRSIRYVIGSRAVDPFDPLESTPISFDAIRLAPIADATRLERTSVEEIVLEGEPWLRIWGAVRREDWSPDSRLTFRCSELGVVAPVRIVPSVDSRFWIWDERIPISSTASSLVVELRRDTNRPQLVEVPTPVAAAFARIDAIIPETRVATLPSPERGIVEVLKACAKESATLLCPVPDGSTPPQAVLRIRLDPRRYDNKIAFYVARASEYLSGRHLSSTEVFRGWQSTIDQQWLPIRIIPPFDAVPGRQYPAQLMVDGLVRHRDLTRFLETTLRADADGSLARYQGDSYHITLYGRGNSYERLGGEELNYVMRELIPSLPVDRRRISIYGSSVGGKAAMEIAIERPGEFAWVHSRAGGLGDILNSAQFGLGDLIENLRGTPLFVEDGELDSRVARSDENFCAALQGRNIFFLRSVRKSAGHFFAPGIPPAAIRAARSQPAPNHVRLRVMTPEHPVTSWVRVDELKHQGTEAMVDATSDSTGHINVKTQNVAALAIVIPQAQLSVRDGLTLDGQMVAHSALTGQWESFVRSGNVWRKGAPAGLEKFRGRSGPAKAIEFAPLMIIYGTTGGEQNYWLRQRAYQVIQTRIGTDESDQNGEARYLIRSDAEVAESELRRYNLWLIGGAAENRLVARILKADGGHWVGVGLGTRTELLLQRPNELVSWLYPSPFARDRYIYVEEGDSPLAYRLPVLAEPETDVMLQEMREGSPAVLRTFLFDSHWETFIDQ